MKDAVQAIETALEELSEIRGDLPDDLAGDIDDVIRRGQLVLGSLRDTERREPAA